ncbi:hypothetical protein BKA62DRAFT_658438 [Auriculariales sp. MPI-PUGE-AT-0066]|nr:hypothetical protein BKA62DRAFT_658438 [Auriculariales sp. MPI-PUGE-AT-0066]
MPKQSRRGPPAEVLQQQKPFACSHCTRRFDSAVRRDEHQDNHQFPCQVAGCLSVLTSSDALRTHMQRHDDERTFTCSIEGCGRSFKTYNDQYQHMRQSHGQVPENRTV